MKRSIAFIILCALSLCLFACEKVDHEQILSEISESNRAKAEKRKVFLDSAVCVEAKEYVLAVLEELIPGCEAQISFEPGLLADADLSVYDDFSENAESRRDFFDKAMLTVKVDFWDHDTDGQIIADGLVARQISGMLMAGESGGDYYDLDAVSGTAELVRLPGV